MKKLIILTCCVFLVFVSILGQQSEKLKEKNNLLNDLVGLENQKAPLFKKAGMDGKEYDLEKLKGKIVVVNLWGTFCSPCIGEMPELNKLVKKFKDKNVVFLAPTPDEKPLLQTFLAKTTFQYQVLPESFDIVQQYAPKTKTLTGKGGFVMLLPTHLIIDQNGVVSKHFWGYGKTTPSILENEIARLLKNKPKQMNLVK